MKKYLEIEDELDGHKDITTDELPLELSNVITADNKNCLSLSIIDNTSAIKDIKKTTYAYIAQDEGHIYFQPAIESSDIKIFHNNEHIEKSVWLKSGDVIQVENKFISYKVSGDIIHLRVDDKASFEIKQEQIKKQIPQMNLIPPPLPVDTLETAKIKKQSKDNLKEDSKQSKTKKNLLMGFSLLLILMAVFVLFAETITIHTEPVADEIKLTGLLPTLKINDRYILLGGDYNLTAHKEGYKKLNKLLKIDTINNEFSFILKEKPGLIIFDIKPKDNNFIYLNNNLIGENNNNQYEIDKGEYNLIIKNPRYTTLEQAIKIEGKDKVQKFKFDLEPNWGFLKLSSEIENTLMEIFSKNNDKKSIYRSQTVKESEIELISGQYEVRISKDKFKQKIEEIKIESGVTTYLKVNALIPEDAQLKLTSNPIGSVIRIDKQYIGKTPQLITLTPYNEHKIQLSLSGYKELTRTINLEAGELSEQNFDLKINKGLVFISVIPAGAKLYIDGKKQNQSSGKFNLGESNHTISVKAKGYKTQTKKIKSSNYSKNITFNLVRNNSVKSKNLKKKSNQVTGINSTPSSKQIKIIKSKSTNYKNSIGQKMILIKPASFIMGSKKNEAGRGSNEREYRAKINYSYFLSDKEITNKQYKQFKYYHNSGIVSGASLNKGMQPVVNVSWNEAAKFTNWLSKKEGLKNYYKEVDKQMIAIDLSGNINGYRLPFEAEWVLAAKGLSQKKYPWTGSFPPKVMNGNFADESAKAYVSNIIEGYNDQNAVSAPVGSYSKNASGFYDLGGNVSEWCQDYYSPNSGISFSGNVIINPTGSEKGTHKVVKDSSWRDASMTELRLNYRSYSKKKAKDIGFRIARNAQ